MSNPRQIIATVAREYIGLRETSKNRGPHLHEFWQATGYKDGDENREPWCSAFASFCVQEADRRSDKIKLRVPPAFAAVVQWHGWAKNPVNGCEVFGPGDMRKGGILKPLAGDIVSFRPKLSHIGIVVKDYDFGGYVETVEGNTNGEGSRDGDGVYEKHRALSFCGLFIRVPAIAKAA